MTQAEIAALFETSIQNVSLHIKEIRTGNSSAQAMLKVRTEGKREVRRTIKLFDWEGDFRRRLSVRSPRGSAFPALGQRR